MNHGPLIFLGVFFALALSWFGLVFEPQLQLGNAQPTTRPAWPVLSPPSSSPNLNGGFDRVCWTIRPPRSVIR